MNFLRNLSKEIVSIAIIVVMIIIAIMSFVGDCNETDSVACLITTIMTMFIYILITLIQRSTKLYNQPYKISKENISQANKLIFDFIFCVKSLSVLLLALFEIAIFLGFDIIIYISFLCFCLILIILTSKCLCRLKCLR